MSVGVEVGGIVALGSTVGGGGGDAVGVKVAMGTTGV
jgi:hypothetical protein